MNIRTTTAVTLIAAATLVLLLGLDIVVRGGISWSPLFALSPVIACIALTAPRTGIFALTAFLAAVVSGLWNDSFDTGQHLVRLLDVAAISAAAVVVAGVRVRQQHQLGRLTVLAEIAQRAVLPVVPVHARQTDIAVRYQSATEDTVIGGDLYDCYHSRSHTRFLIGDVRGKGIGAVEQAARVIRAFRQAAAIQPELHEVAEEMSGYLVPFFEEEEFVTALLVDTTSPSRPQLVNAGHPAPLLVRADGSHTFLETRSDLPLGLGAQYSQHVFDWEPGDRLLLYTDGVSEARDRDGVFLDLASLVPLLLGEPLDSTLDALLAAVRAHSARHELSDDVAVMILEHTAEDQEERPMTSQHDWLALVGR